MYLEGVWTIVINIVENISGFTAWWNDKQLEGGRKLMLFPNYVLLFFRNFAFFREKFRYLFRSRTRAGISATKIYPNKKRW